MVTTREMRDVAMMGLRDARYEIGPFITLVDGPRFEEIWEQRRPLLIGHASGSDLAAISRSDLIQPETVERIRSRLAPHHQRIIAVGGSDGLEDILALYNENPEGPR